MPEHDPFSPESAVVVNADTSPAPAAEPAPSDPVATGAVDAVPAVSQPEPVAPAPDPEAEVIDVPKGSTREILEWVGDDKERAIAALQAEHESDDPRKGLTRELEERVE